MKHKLILNGVDAPLLRQFGCDCARCAQVTKQANLSASLLSFDEGNELAHHTLFDAGEGVADSLVDHPELRGNNGRLDQIFLTHWHRDHTAGLNRLLGGWALNIKRRTGSFPPKLPLWCRQGTAAWMHRYYDFELDKFIEMSMSDENAPPGTVLEAVPVASIADITITPVTLSHWTADFTPGREAVAYCCCGYVLESAGTKMVLMWDLDNQNDWLTRPQTAAHEAAIEKLADADHLFVDCSFWHPFTKPISHASFLELLEFAPRLRPKETLLVHLSGHPDGWRDDGPDQGGYGWTNEQWTENAQEAWAKAGLGGTVRAPSIGDTFWF